MNKEKIIVLYGGNSPERKISLKSGKTILCSLLKNNYNAFGLDTNVNYKTLIKKILLFNPKKCFIALHGKDGENGRISALLEMLKIKHTSSSMKSSIMSMDKMISKLIWMSNGILTPKAKFLTNGLVVDNNINFPVVIKPTNGGSSIGTFKVESKKNLKEAYIKASKYGKVMIEQWITGKEISVAILNNEVYSSVLVEPQNRFYDYESKYSGKSVYHYPSGLCQKKELEVRKLAKKAYDLINCSGHARVDFICDKNDNFYILELNSSPGMTKNSLSPKSALAEGIDFDNFINKIIKQAK